MFQQELGDGVRLKLLEVPDTDDLFQLTNENREALRRWLPWVDAVRAPSDTARFISASQQQWASNQGFQAGIWVQDRLAGVVGVHGVDWANRATTLGYWLGEQYQGRGVMTRSCRALLETAFGVWGVERAELRAAVGNAASRAVAERLGFTLEGVLRSAEWLYDHFVDHAVYSLLRVEWMEAARSEGT